MGNNQELIDSLIAKWKVANYIELHTWQLPLGDEFDRC
jgi:hypothetical protein